MREYVERKIPIMKRSVSTDDAIELFEKLGMYDKARLFRYRMVSRSISKALTGLRTTITGTWCRIQATSSILT